MIERDRGPAADPSPAGGVLSSQSGRPLADFFRDAAQRCLSILHLAASRGEDIRGVQPFDRVLFSEHRSGLELDQAKAAFKALGWRTDGAKGPAHHDPDAPLLTESSPGFLSLRIDHRTFQPAAMLLSEARSVQQTITEGGGLRDFTPLKLAEGLFIVPYQTTEALGLRDTHCGVFKSEQAARGFAASKASNLDLV